MDPKPEKINLHSLLDLGLPGLLASKHSQKIERWVQEYRKSANAGFWPEKSIVTFNRMGMHSFGGDLGNQLFQFAAVIAYAKLHNITPKIPDPAAIAFQNAGVKMQNFQIPAEMYSSVPVEAAIIDEKSFNIRSNWGLTFLVGPVTQGKIVNIDLVGFFQNYIFAEYAKKEIKKYLQFDSETDAIAASIIKKIKDKNKDTTIVAVHYRSHSNQKHFAKDSPFYKKNVDTLCHPILPIEYYNKAFNVIRNKHSKVKFLIISNSTAEAKSIFCGDDFIYAEDFYDEKKNLKSKLDILDRAATLPAIVDFALMVKSDNVVISNSTFSWWAGWLNESDHIIVPSKTLWFGDKLAFKNLADLYPNTWEEVWAPQPYESTLESLELDND